MNLLVLVVVNAPPVFEPTVNPEKVIVPALPLFVICMMHDPSFDGAARVNAPPLVMYCNGDAPQSTV
jgi:hypothetical protein